MVARTVVVVMGREIMLGNNGGKAGNGDLHVLAAHMGLEIWKE